MKGYKLGGDDAAADSRVLECDTTSLGQGLMTFQRTVEPSKDQEPLSQWKSITSRKT